jgi:tetratricopeptide (TPR) repeat protein
LYFRPRRLYHTLKILAREMKQTLFQTLLQQGIAASKAGQRQEACQILQKVIELNPGSESAWLWLSGVVDDLQERRHCLEQVLRINPNNAHAPAGLAWIEQKLAQSAAAPVAETQPQPEQDTVACPFCNQLVSLQSVTCPHCQRDLVVVCPVCEAMSDIEKPACEVCGYKIGDYRQGIAYYADLAGAYLANLKASLAIAAWEQVLEMAPAYPDGYLRLGEAQVEAGDLQGAQASFEQLLSQAEHPASAYLGLGNIYERRRKWDEAQKAYTKAVEADESSATARFYLGRLLIEDNALRDAFSHIYRATELDPKHAEAWFLLGQLYEMARERKKAIKAYEHAAALPYPHRDSDNQKASKEAAERLKLLRPSLPPSIALSWPETLRQTGSLALIPALAALVNAGLRPWQIVPLDFLGALLAALGAYLWVSATVTPRNPGIRAMLGPEGLSQPALRATVGLLGGLFWVTGMLSILLLPTLFAT